MIVEISNAVTSQYGKKNWIDQNLVVFGYSDTSCCCEEWGWGVYDPETKKKVADSPNGMPYHFSLSSGVDKQEFAYNSGNDRRLAFKDEVVDQLDCVRVTLLPDEGIEGKPLVFEAYTHHNGYYLHGFSFSDESSCTRPLF